MKIAIAVVHGVGKQEPAFAEPMRRRLERLCGRLGGAEFVIHPVYWSPVFKRREAEALKRAQTGGALRYPRLRRFVMGYLGDAIAYQMTPGDRRAYDRVHEAFADTLRALAAVAGPTAPLCVIAHSLGTVIASNYLYDLQADESRNLIAPSVRARMGSTPLDRGETLTLFYTLGSPIALWSLRYREFGLPIRVPSPHLTRHHPALRGEWINFYDQDDVVATPLRSLNEDYGRVVTEDRQVNVGNLLTHWNPFSHLSYWTTRDVLKPIAAALVRTWKAINT